MSRIHAIFIGIFLLIVIAMAGWLCNRKVSAERASREGTFISIYFHAQAAHAEGGEISPDLKALFQSIGFGAGTEEILMRPFPDGLVYRPSPSSFTLEEPKERPVALFESDRLISSDRNWPTWEKSGEKATK